MLHERLPYLESCGARKWGKTKENGGAGYEANTCFMARAVREPAQSLNVSDKCFAQVVGAESYTLARRIPTPPFPHS
jgi:hypothetical protein